VARLNDAVAHAESSLHGRVRLFEASLSRAVCDTEEAEAAHHSEMAAAWENIKAQHGQQAAAAEAADLQAHLAVAKGTVAALRSQKQTLDIAESEAIAGLGAALTIALRRLRLLAGLLCRSRKRRRGAENSAERAQLRLRLAELQRAWSDAEGEVRALREHAEDARRELAASGFLLSAGGSAVGARVCGCTDNGSGAGGKAARDCLSGCADRRAAAQKR
jgi:hypothetical protein